MGNLTKGAAGWFPDASRLRSFLDDLAAALPKHSPLSSAFLPQAKVSEYDRIWASVSKVLGEVEKYEGGAKAHGLYLQYQPGHQAAALAATLSELSLALQSRVQGALGPEKVAAALQLLSSPMPDLLRILGREEDENTHSQFIAWLLDPRRAPNVSRHALASLCKQLPDEEQWLASVSESIAGDCLSVRREYVIAKELHGVDDLPRIDIVVTAPGLVLAIENKVRSKEHSDQTKTYWRWMEQTRGLRAGLFLSPSGQRATCDHFRPLSYFDLLSVFLEAPVKTKLLEAEVLMLSSYLKTLVRTIIPVEGRALKSLGRNS